MKVLIIGFPRSGTSLTHRIFDKHQDIKRMFFESLLLYRNKDKNIKREFPEFRNGRGVGEKIIYEKLYIGKTNEHSYIDYCHWWNDLFGDEARIIQVMRHPYDVWNSIIKMKYLMRGIPDKVTTNLKKYFQCVPKYMEQIMEFENSYTFKLEHLIQHTDEVVKELYDHCGLDINRSKFDETMKPNKLFNYKRDGFLIDRHPKVKYQKKEFWKLMDKNVPRVMNFMNQIEGPKYEER